MPRPRPPLTARCELCQTFETVDAPGDVVRVELEARGWFPCPRNGAKVAWRCPEHDLRKRPPATTTTHGPATEWV